MPQSPLLFRSGETLLFQGDSLTCCGRNREQLAPNNACGLGNGYVLHIAAALAARVASDQLQIYNRGIDGEGIDDLAVRWQNDCLALKPTVLSILVGINDVARSVRDGLDEAMSSRRFEQGYRELLAQSHRHLPDVRLVLCEPVVLHCGKVSATWLPVCTARRAIVRDLAAEFAAVFVPIQGMFDEATSLAPPTYWLHDGVHPTIAGHHLIARRWMKCVLEDQYANAPPGIPE